MIRFLVLALMFFIAARLLRRVLQTGRSARGGDRRERGAARDGRPDERERYPDAIDADYEDLDRR